MCSSQALSDMGCSPDEAVMIGDVSMLSMIFSDLLIKIHQLLAQTKTSLLSLVFPQDARDDVGGAQNAGMLGILVRTGKDKLLTPHENSSSVTPQCLHDIVPLVSLAARCHKNR